MTGKNQKQYVRKRLLSERQKISEVAYQAKSDRICRRVKELPEFKKAEIVHCYVSMNERREVNTQPMIKELLPGSKKIVVPVMKDKGRLKHIRLDALDDLKPNQWQVLEPAAGDEVSPDRLDIILVPMVGGDLRKNRIGYGGGYYDRFLQQLSCPAIGLLFERCLVDELPVKSFDIPLTKLVTEKQIIS